jgi:hypothetical protein
MRNKEEEEEETKNSEEEQDSERRSWVMDQHFREEGKAKTA